MVESGVRYVVTTIDGVYITPGISMSEDNSSIKVLDVSDMASLRSTTLPITSILSVVKETYSQEDLTSQYVREDLMV